MNAFRAAALLLVVGIAGFASATALGRHSHALSCSTVEGTVQLYVSTTRHSCNPIITALMPLYRVETLTTGLTGSSDFGTSYFYQCHEFHSSSDVLAPSVTIAIRHLGGKSWCKHLATSKIKRLISAGQVIVRMTGTIVGLDTSKKGTLVQVAEGSVVVSRFGQTGSLTLTQNTQGFIPVSGALPKATAIVLSPTDAIAVAELQADVIDGGTGGPAIPQFIQSRGEKAAVVIGDTSVNARVEAGQIGTSSAILRSDQVTARPQVVSNAMQKYRTHTIVTTGALKVMQPIWQLIRNQVDLPPDTAIIFVAR